MITGKNLPLPSPSPPLSNQLLVNITSPSSSHSPVVDIHTQLQSNHTTAFTPTTAALLNKAAAAVAAVDDSSDSDKVGEDEDLTYRLMAEIQDVLIEDFFPPMSSSTVPGNPGRLYVILP